MNYIWILWWLGPETTAKFYLQLNQISDLKYRIPVILYNTPIDLELEKKFLLSTNWIEKYFSYLKNGIDVLEKAGSKFVVIPCNSVHWLIDKLRETTNIPVLSIIEETTKYLVKNNIKSVWILSSWYTAKSKIYEKKLKKSWIKIFSIWKEEQDNVNNIILNLVQWKKHKKEDTEYLNKLIQNFKEQQGVDKVLLACTDLQNIVEQTDFIVDSMNVLLNVTYDYFKSLNNK